MVSVMLVLGYVESLIPGQRRAGHQDRPCKFRLAVRHLCAGRKAGVCADDRKVLLSGLTFGGVNAMMCSLAGGVLSMAAMLIVRRVPGTGILGVSIAGAAMHNLGQVLLAMIVL